MLVRVAQPHVRGWLACAVFGLTAATAYAQRPAVIGGAPAAHWIADTTSSPDGFGVYHFRRVFELAAKPDEFVVHVSADNRYRLLVNGEAVSSGPQRSDLAHWRYETVDLAPALRAGRNVIAATVWNWGNDRPVAQESRRSAFLLQGATQQSAVASTGRPGWRVLRDAGYTAIPVNSAELGYYAASPGESLDAQQYPWGWDTADFSDAAWPIAGKLDQAQTSGTNEYGVVSTWQLMPRTIPAMEETPVRFVAVRRSDGVAVPNESFLRGADELVVPPRTHAVLLLDQGYLTTAFMSLETSGGEGARMSLTYAEALVDAQGRKGNRADIANRKAVGLRDAVMFDGGARRRFRTLWFRAFRFVSVEIETAGQALTLHDIHGIFTAYPYVERGRFSSDAAWIDSVWTMSWRTARVCANETYFDTPYYEQLQYVGDTRIQALISLYVAGDDRLVRNAIEHFDWSRTADGLTASRYPSALPQYIPPFSLIWVMMVHDYWMLRDDPTFVRRFLPGIRGVLGWFERRVDSTRLVRAGDTPWWGFVDWAPQWERGAPPGAESGHSVAVSLQYVYALEQAAELESALGVRQLAASYRRSADSIGAAVRARAWDARRQLFRDAPDSALYSQQTNTLAVLAGVLSGADSRRLVERILVDSTLVQASYYFQFYTLEALRLVALGDRYVEQLSPWRQMLAMGFTTTPEAPEPSRSDSHAWSAHPNYGLLATVLGVRAAAPGFRAVLIEPHLGSLTRAEGRVPHPRGDIDVSLTRVPSGLRAEVTLPLGVTGTFVWHGRRVALHPGRQTLSL